MSSSNAMPWRLVIAACIGMFAATATGSTRAPFLTDMALDLQVSLPAIANLFGLTATVWGISSYITGYSSDRIGRRLFLLASPVCLALTMVAAANAPNYWILVGIIILAATCCGAYTSAALTEVSVRTPNNFQGRALGYVMSGQSLTLLVGIPTSAWLGAIVGWRGIHVALAALALFSAFTMYLALRRRASDNAVSTSPAAARVPISQVMSGPIIRLFLALIAERVCFGLATFYYASYLRTVYDLPIEAVAFPLVLFAIGNIIGTVAGGQVADRLPYRRISFAIALCCAGCIALPWFLWQQSPFVTITFGVAFAFFNALSRPSLLAALAEVPANVRGVVMGLNSSFASVGWLVAALVGGWLYAGIGFTGFGPVMFVMCLMASAVVVPDSRIRYRAEL